MSRSFEEIWNGVEEFEFPDTVELCLYARRYSEWSRELLERSTRSASLVSINQSKVLLLDKYFEWRSVAPKAHRNRTSGNGHTCLFQVFEQAYITLRAMELAITPPMLFIPERAMPPSLPPPPQIAGIFLGELSEP